MVTLEDLRMIYEDWMWKYGFDRLELARLRLAAHRKAIAEGRNSPYTHIEEYNF